MRRLGAEGAEGADGGEHGGAAVRVGVPVPLGRLSASLGCEGGAAVC